MKWQMQGSCMLQLRRSRTHSSAMTFNGIQRDRTRLRQIWQQAEAKGKASRRGRTASKVIMIIQNVQEVNQREREFTQFGQKYGILFTRSRMGVFRLDFKEWPQPAGASQLPLSHPLHRQAQDHHPLQAHLQQFSEFPAEQTIYMFFQSHYASFQWGRQDGTDSHRVQTST